MQDDNPDYWVGFTTYPVPQYLYFALAPPFTGQSTIGPIGLGGAMSCQLLVQPVGEISVPFASAERSKPKWGRS
jgi:hypothetical protein